MCYALMGKFASMVSLVTSVNVARVTEIPIVPLSLTIARRNLVTAARVSIAENRVLNANAEMVSKVDFIKQNLYDIYLIQIQ